MTEFIKAGLFFLMLGAFMLGFAALKIYAVGPSPWWPTLVLGVLLGLVCPDWYHRFVNGKKP